MSIFTQRINSALAFGLCAAFLSGCGSGAGGGSALPQSAGRAAVAQAAKTAAGNVKFSVAFRPKVPAGRIAPQYVSPSTQSLQILTDGAAPVVVNLTPSSPNCLPDPAAVGTYICSASLNVAPGNHIFTVTAYDLTGAKGNILSANSTGKVNVTPSGTTAVPLVLEGSVYYVILALGTVNPPIGTPATIALTATLEDADQNLIVGPAPYEHPVTLTTTDPLNAPLSKTVLNSPADAAGITVKYTGAKIARVTYGATAIGLTTATVVSADLTPGAAEQFLAVVNDTIGAVVLFDASTLSGGSGFGGGGEFFFEYGAAIDAQSRIYVAGGGGDSVGVFDLAHGDVTLATITGGGLSYPIAVTVDDESGKLFVLNYATSSISVFDTKHAYAPLAVISGGGMAPSLRPRRGRHRS
jgi:hypothetical protein